MINSFTKSHKTNYYELNYEMIEGKFEKEEMILCPTPAERLSPTQKVCHSSKTHYGILF
jgi:hypothetical protein